MSIFNFSWPFKTVKKVDGILNDENQNTNQQNFSSTTDKKLIALEVISRPGRSPYDTFSVLVPESLSVDTNTILYLNNIKVGQVYEKIDDVAKVRLISSPGVLTEARLKNAGIDIEAKGMGGGAFEIFIPRGISVSVGDEVVGGESDVIARVVSISDDGTLLRILATLPFNVYEVGEFFAKGD